MANILLIEPNQLLARQYTESLQSAGHELTHLADAQAAIVAADRQQPDIIILELLLAKHSGIEFLYELRSYSEWQHIPVIILSRVAAADSGIDNKRLEELGIARYLYKPDTSLKKLAEVIGRALT